MAFISIAWRGQNARHVAGEPSAAFGHRITLPDGDSDGVHAGWRFDAGRLTLDVDRYGFYPLFSSIAGDACSIATSVRELLALGVPRAFDYDALSVFLRVGFFLEDDTPFRAIRAVPPSPHLDASGGSLRLVGSLPVPRLQTMSREAAVDAYIERFRLAIAKRAPSGPFQLPLSGGRDSRHILFELARQGHSPDACVTVEHFPPRDNDDVAVAAALCGALGLRHIVLRQPSDRAGVEADKNERTHLCTDEHAQFVVLADHLCRETAETYDGIAGDVLSQSSYLTPAALAVFQDGDVNAAAAFVLDGYGTTVSERALATLLTPSFLREIPRERATARIARAIAAHAGAPNPVEAFFFWNRTRREVALAPFGLMRDVRVHAPYLDRDVFELLSGLPASIELDRRLHTDAIAQAFPQFASIPYEHRGRRARGAGQRNVAAALARTVVGSRLLRSRTLLPGIAAAGFTGSVARLWHMPLTFYLAHLEKVADASQ